MKLFYYKDEAGNFGDDLNPWLWDKLLPGFFNEDESAWLIGIGTLLNHKLPVGGVKHVFGSGYGYGSKPKIDNTYNFLCVRGPKTAKELDLPASLALTDSAILIKAINIPEVNKQYKFGYIPHHTSVGNFSWENLCTELNLNFINPEWPVDKVLKELGKCEVVMCEAMHGAIVCDALRIPWIPIKCYDYISEFKWQDWLLTVDIDYEPVEVTSLFDAERRLTQYKRQQNRLKRVFKSMGAPKKYWTGSHPANSSQKLINRASKELGSATQSKVFLSKESTCNSLFERYLEKLEVLKNLPTNFKA